MTIYKLSHEFSRLLHNDLPTFLDETAPCCGLTICVSAEACQGDGSANSLASPSTKLRNSAFE